MINLIIDRVGNVNVFNALDGSNPSSESHLQSIMDDDLILEYQSGIENLIRVSHAIHGIPNSSNHYLKTDILNELRILGETFYFQFFPKEIAEKLKTTTDKSIHFNLDPKLAIIPWELLHDGNCFLADKFYIGKTIRGGFHNSPNKQNDKLKMLIIADPSEDLPWAEKEGEELFKVLSEKVSSSRLEIEYLGGKQVTKLKILSSMKDKNIIHYAGHLFFSDDPLENGWLLSDGKVLRAREIKNSGISTDLVFSNSCLSSKSVQKKLNPNIMNVFGGSFLMSGIKNFIGTNWEIIDNEKTIDFTIRFYIYLFSDKSIGESLYLSREFARRNYPTNDLTWANYSLYGNPDFIILPNLENQSHNIRILNHSYVYNFYPTPIAQSYLQFIQSQKDNLPLSNQMALLIRCFESFTKIIGTIVYSNHRYHSLGTKNFPFHADDAIPLDKWWDLIYSSLWDFRKLKITPIIDTLPDILNSNKEIIHKIISWQNYFSENKIHSNNLESYLITLQYYYENLLLELSEFEKVSIFLISENSNYHYFFKGLRPMNSLVTSPMFQEDYVGEQIEKYRGKLVIYHEQKKIIIPLLVNIVENPEKQELELNFPGFFPAKFLFISEETSKP